jgi:DNA-binding PadR family transcriptional regulator
MTQPMTPVTYHILLALADQGRHGYGILKEVEALTGGSLELETGTLYAAIRRLRSEGLIEAAPPVPGEDRRRKNYQLTREGTARLRLETRRLERLIQAAEAKRVLPASG